MLLPAYLSFGSCTSLAAAAAPTHQTEKSALLNLPFRSSCLVFSSNTNFNFNGGLQPKSLFLNTSKNFKTSVAVQSDQVGSSDPAEKEVAKKYYFVVANAKFMLDEEEHFQEQLSERLRLFGERNMEQDFWLVIEPKFLDKFPNITKRLRRPAVALVSTNRSWITFMKLRLDRVLSESFEADSLEEALASTPTKIEFKKPENWVAPYPKYEYGWWEPFLPQPSSKTEVWYLESSLGLSNMIIAVPLGRFMSDYAILLIGRRVMPAFQLTDQDSNAMTIRLNDKFTKEEDRSVWMSEMRFSVINYYAHHNDLARAWLNQG